MKHLTLDLSKLKPFIDDSSIAGLQEELSISHKLLISRSGKGNNFLGWIDCPCNLTQHWSHASLPMPKRSGGWRKFSW